MTYTVEWSEDAGEQLAELWLESSDRKAVTEAQAQIDVALSRRPHEVAADVAEGLYRISLAPLRVLFEIHDTARLVRVVSVREE